MTENIPKWITNLALEIYNVIKKHDAMPRFQEMVQKWAREHEAEIERHKKWQEQRELHFEKNVASDPRLKDKQAGPPKKGWEWETYVLHPYEETESGLQRTSKPTFGWVPPELSMSSKPEITHILPLSREHELTLVEKYTVLAAIYDCGRKGTEEIAPWKWPGPDAWNEPSALSNAKKSIFFVGLCDGVSELTPDAESWLQLFLKDVKRDITCWKEPTQPTQEKILQTSSFRKVHYDTLVANLEAPEPPLVFISYSREDRKWLVDILEGLDPLIRQKRVKVWIDESIEPGKKWRLEIEAAIHDAKGALLLVSRHYLASDFINEKELPYLFKAAQKGLRILWILVGDCMWEETFLKDIQAVIKPNIALNNLSDGERDIYIKRIAEVIRDTFAKKND